MPQKQGVAFYFMLL